MTSIEKATQAYANYFAGLTRDNVEDLRAMATPDIRFKDPFNEITGVDQVIGLLRHMFDTTIDARFTIRDQAIGSSIAFISWDFHCSVARLGKLNIVGASEIRFRQDLRVAAHIDHWDAGEQVYQRVPLLGSLLHLVKRRLAFPG